MSFNPNYVMRCLRVETTSSNTDWWEVVVVGSELILKVKNYF